MQDVSLSPPHRVAFVTGGLNLGGSTTFLLNLAEELIQRNIPAEVFSFEIDHPMVADFQARSIPVLCLDQSRLIYEDRLRVVLGQLARFRPTVVISTLGAVSFEVLRYLPPGIFRIGMGQSDDPLVYEMMRHYASWMDLVAMVSQTMKQKAGTLPEFTRVPVAYLPLGVPMCRDTDLPERDFKAQLRILYLGRLAQEQKRVRLFTEIFSQLCTSGIPFHWTIAGDGPDRAFLEAEMKSISPRQTVAFAGPVRYADVPAILREHDVFLLASEFEGLPLSLLEAMGHGLVPVVSDLKSGIPEVVDETNGLLVPVNGVAGYARAIIHLHEHRDELAAKSATARKRVQKDFSVAAMTGRWLATFPPPPTSAPIWPTRWKISAPLAVKQPLYFSPPLRFLRRLVVRFRK
jgi:glycosyltransferase involved in cell wall biosynthesis